MTPTVWVLIADPADEARLTAVLGMPVRFVPDSAPGEGPRAALAGALSALPGEYALLLAVDYPHMKGEFLCRMYECLRQQSPSPDALIPVWAGKPQVTCGFYHRRLAPALTAAFEKGERSLQRWLQSQPSGVVYLDYAIWRAWSGGEELFLNVNRPEEYEPFSSRTVSDQFGRVKRKLRISVTDRCNFRCAYCMPEQPEWKPREQILTFEELVHLSRVFVERLGIQQIRLTGGEPLLRKGIEKLVARLKELQPYGLQRLSLTTNGVLLRRLACSLRAAGLADVNISLDAVDPEKFRQITGGGELQPVLEGIEAAREAGLEVKVNAVLIRGLNEDQILPLAQWAYEQSLPLRYIEFMPLDGRGFWQPERVVTEQEILQCLSQRFEITPLPNRGAEPATYYRLNGSGLVGIIPSVSNPFCAACDRLRLTADGTLLTCLFSVQGCDLRTPLRQGAEEASLEALIREAVYKKEAGFVALRRRSSIRHLPMHAIGG